MGGGQVFPSDVGSSRERICSLAEDANPDLPVPKTGRVAEGRSLFFFFSLSLSLSLSLSYPLLKIPVFFQGIFWANLVFHGKYLLF